MKTYTLQFRPKSQSDKKKDVFVLEWQSTTVDRVQCATQIRRWVTYNFLRFLYNKLNASNDELLELIANDIKEV